MKILSSLKKATTLFVFVINIFCKAEESLIVGPISSCAVKQLSSMLGHEGPATNRQEKIAVFITGSGRCGTSCTAGILDIMGLELGSSLCGANQYNEKGGFEDKRIIALNERLFKELDMDIHKPKYHIDWNRFYEPFKNQIKHSLNSYFRKLDVFGIKHPYISYLLPAYIGAAKELGYTPKIIIVMRHPAEIAQSFAHRHPQKPISQFYELISVSLMSLLEHAQGCEVLVLHYEDLIFDIKATVEKIHDFLPHLSSYDSIEGLLSDFVDQQLKHENSSS